MGAFGLSVPAEHGGYSEGGDGEYMGMVVATEELSRGSLGIGGSLITRPEILTRALVKGGTEAQKAEWLPKLATAEVMAAVAVTEPDFGSDVAGLKVTATPAPGPDGSDGYVINGVKTWCTFAARADVLMLLARTDPDRSKAHRGLSLFIVPKPRGDAHGFEFTQPAAARSPAEDGGRPIDTIGYRGMHSYEVALDNWWVPAANLIGEQGRTGQGLLLPDGGVRERAVADRRARCRRDAGVVRSRARLRPQPEGLRLTDRRVRADQVKLGRMAVLVQAGRQFSYAVARMMAKGEGAMEAAWSRPTSARPPNGSPARRCRSTAGTATPRSTRSAASTSTPASCRSSKAPTRPSASRSSRGA
jgi:(2S)-methylsuccinyl-CoA dehydrogenase